MLLVNSFNVYGPQRVLNERMNKRMKSNVKLGSDERSEPARVDGKLRGNRSQTAKIRNPEQEKTSSDQKTTSEYRKKNSDKT